MIEYWLQKKTIGGWSMVTSYQELEQAQRNYNSCVGNGLSGYSWRLCKMEVVEVSMLNDVVELSKDVVNAIDDLHAVKAVTGWGTRPADILVQDASKNPEQPTRRAWGQNSIQQAPSQDTGLSKPDGRGAKPGSVCMMHHGLKKRCRAMPGEATYDMLILQGWVHGGPRTQFE